MAETRPLVSIITSTYKGARFIERSIKSVLLQTMPNFEHVIVDDGSFDGTEQVVGQFDDPRIVYIKREGPHSVFSDNAKNVAIRAARGKYLSYLDHDDAYRPKFLATLSSYLEEHLDVGFVFCDFYWHRQQWNLEGDGLWYEYSQRKIGCDFDLGVMKYKNIIGSMTPMHHRDVVNEVGYFKRDAPGTIHPPGREDDWDYWLRIAQYVLAQQLKVVRLPVVLADYVSKNSIHYWDKDYAPWKE